MTMEQLIRCEARLLARLEKALSTNVGVDQAREDLRAFYEDTL